MFVCFSYFTDFPFDFVFLLPLRNVDEDCSLAQLLVKEHELEDVDTVAIWVRMTLSAK